MSQKLDPVTMEIIQAGFTASAEEMKLNLIRTAYNPLVYEVLDFAVGLFDVEGRTLAQASGLPLFLATLPAAIIDGLETYGPDGFEPGDVIMTNDPYTTGTHLGDMKVYSPIFFENDLVGFAATMAHLIDLGGKAAWWRLVQRYDGYVPGRYPHQDDEVLQTWQAERRYCRVHQIEFALLGKCAWGSSRPRGRLQDR